MKYSVAVAKESDTKKGISPTMSDKSINRVQHEPERKVSSLGGVTDNIRHDGGTPSVESIAANLSSMHTAERAPALLALQQTHGNRCVQRVVAGIRAKLKVGQAGDKYEQEADRVADAVMGIAEPAVQRQEEEEELAQPNLASNTEHSIQRQVEEEEEFLQTKELTGHDAEIIPDLESRIQVIRGSGEPLPESVRTYFEPRFGHDFSQVQVHTGAQSAETARSLKARAFTVGRDVVFGTGQYAPRTVVGKKLLAHELAHVVQQTKQAASTSGSSPGDASSHSSLGSVLQMRKWRRRRRRSRSYWRRVKGKLDVWKTVRPFATLEGLAYRVSRRRQNWMCIRPVRVKYPVKPYWQHISLGDEFDVSNLTKTTGPSLEGHELAGNQAQWAQHFYGVAAFGGSPDQEIAKTAKGNTPIASMLIIGHTNTTTMGRLNLSNLNPDKPDPTYARAVAGEFPRRCLFTRNARVRAVGCSSRAFGTRFARVYLRRPSSRIVVTTRPVCMGVVRNRWRVLRNRRTGRVVRIVPLPDQYRVCFSQTGGPLCYYLCLTRWYTTRRGFHRGRFWATIYGRL